MLSTMMHTPLGVAALLEFGHRHFADSRVGDYDGHCVRWSTYAEVEADAARLANALASEGLEDADVVATFMWNSAAHLSTYLAVPAMGGVLHTVNCRLAAEQISYIINHAADQFVLVDGRLEEQFAPVLASIPKVRKIIVVDPQGGLADDPRVVSYADFIGGHPDQFAWREVDEDQAAGICYTSGTTGNPKGVVYSQKTTYLHALASRAVDSFAVCERDTILMLPSMFHANAWGFPYSGWLSGSDMLMPGPYTQVDHLRAMIEAAQPTLTALVPTVLGDLLLEHDRKPLDLSSFRSIICGGSAVPSAMIKRVDQLWQVPVIQGWGMTETSPMCVLSHPPKKLDGREAIEWQLKSGRPVPGVSVRIVDEAGAQLPNDGATIGELELRGAWVASGYLKVGDSPCSSDGWLRTGDIGNIDARGFVQLTDRKKDVIKSGGEWISSLDLEDVLLTHPEVEEAAVIAIPDERWQERPFALVVAKQGSSLNAVELRAFLQDLVARFWVPEYWLFVGELDRTSVGKVDKKLIRERFLAGELLPE